MKFSPFGLLTLVSLTTSSLAAGADPFQELVRPTEPLTPAQEQAAFHLPAGFEIQLVASEPDLRKPMNMQWDVLGRLWITESREYPFAIKDGSPGRDTVRIFSDFGADGKARKVEIFADGLNVPTGLYPFRSANAAGKLTWKCVVWSIPNIWLMEDTDGDGKADKREPLYGPLGWERDTHGNLSSFRRGQDGWLYGTHGFNNESTIRGRDGSELHIQSGNTWRVRLDGTRVEGNTWGQVNPFGLCWDDRGNLFSADCHSSPIYQLLRGAYYPSFGKPHDGLGFAPQTILHSHGSTAICAPIYVSDPAWPAELQDHMFVGNVQTSRINHDAITWHGSSSKGKEMPDFLSTDDPWFRPVDLSWGPDGALYVADFYNKIIGHYEVPLNHPGRDRERGRLWRIVYRGGKPGPGTALPAELAGLIGELGNGNPTRRTLALNEICDQFGAQAIQPLKDALAANSLQKVNALWALSRLGGLEASQLLAATKDADALVRVHAFRLAREWCVTKTTQGKMPQTDALAAAARAGLKDADGLVARCAAEVLGANPASENIRPLLDLLRRAPKDDDHLIHLTRLALRDQCRAADVTADLDGFSAEELRPLLEIMLAVPGEQTALLRFALFEKMEVPADLLAKQLPSLAKNLPPTRIDSLVALARKRLGGDRDAQAAVIQSVLEALAQRGTEPGPTLREWGAEVATALLEAKENAREEWTFAALDGSAAAQSPWVIQERPCADGQKAQVISSFPRGEQLTGVLRSASFALPETLRFYLCGHDGQPEQPAKKKNGIRLRDAADGKVLREAAPPRNDTAQRIEWKLQEFKGRSGYIEITDGDTGAAYAWLAAGRFEPALPQLALRDPSAGAYGKALAADLARGLHLKAVAPQLSILLADRKTDGVSRVSAARALLSIDTAYSAEVGAVLGNDATPLDQREKLAAALGEAKSPAADSALIAGLKAAPHRLQLTLATALAGTRNGAEALVSACADGQAAPALLRDKALSDRLKAINNAALNTRIEQLTANLPPANAELDKLIAARRAAFAPAQANAVRGADVFARNCAVCHAIDNKGGNIGPQLDGIGGRGPDRLLEDILDPSRNVDRAFRLLVVTKRDGSLASGLFRREEGSQLVLADLAAQETRIDKNDIVTKKETETSLMPPSFGEVIPAAELSDLLAYLLSKQPNK
ncbi:MAG: Cytochrome c [Chthoniobacteraceae bacterium]|nr:Cytochrome c [Chthoniobacteraceae bacterium]